MMTVVLPLLLLLLMMIVMLQHRHHQMYYYCCNLVGIGWMVFQDNSYHHTTIEYSPEYAVIQVL
jgi:hypothetical protein